MDYYLSFETFEKLYTLGYESLLPCKVFQDDFYYYSEDMREIMWNEYVSKRFFGEDFEEKVAILRNYLKENQKEDAEKYILENAVFLNK